MLVVSDSDYYPKLHIISLIGHILAKIVRMSLKFCTFVL